MLMVAIVYVYIFSRVYCAVLCMRRRRFLYRLCSCPILLIIFNFAAIRVLLRLPLLLLLSEYTLRNVWDWWRVPANGRSGAIVTVYHCFSDNLCAFANDYPPKAFWFRSVHPSYGDCLEVKREYYQSCSVLGCVTPCSQSAAHLYQQFLQVQQIRFVTLGPLGYAMHGDGCLELYYCNTVEWCWWDSSLICKTNWFPSVLWHCWFGQVTCKNRPRYDL